jgi:hypothetical protein
MQGHTFLISSLSTFTGTSATPVGVSESKQVKIMLELAHDAMNMLPSILVFHLGRVPHKMARRPEGNWVLPMEAMAANTTGIPATASLLLALSILLLVAMFPTRLRVVILKWKHPQAQSDNQPNEPDNRGDNAVSLMPYSHPDGA